MFDSIPELSSNQFLGVTIFVTVYFLLLKTSLNWQKESLIGQSFFVGTIRYLFSQLKKTKQIFVLHNSKFR